MYSLIGGLALFGLFALISTLFAVHPALGIAGCVALFVWAST